MGYVSACMVAITVIFRIGQYTVLFLRGLIHINDMALQWRLPFRDVDQALVVYHLGEFDQDYRSWSRDRFLNWLQACRLSLQVFSQAISWLRQEQRDDRLSVDLTEAQLAQHFGRSLLYTMRQYIKDYGDTPMILEASGRYLTLGKFLERATSEPEWFDQQAVMMYELAQQAERHRL